MVLLCWIHQDRNWSKKVKWLTDPNEFDVVFKALKNMRYAKTEKEFFSLLAKFKKLKLYENNKELQQYFVKWFKPEIYKMWVYAYRRDTFRDDQNTTNAVEGVNKLRTHCT